MLLKRVGEINMADVKNEKNIYDYFDLINQAKTKKERERYIDEALLSEPNNLQLLLMKNEKNRGKQAEYFITRTRRSICKKRTI